MKAFYLLMLLFFHLNLFAQARWPKVEMLQNSKNTSLRGLSVVTDRVLWVSGTNGTIGKSTDGGATWKWMVVKGFEKRDFRDIEAFDATNAVIMCVDTPAYILRTVNAGETWRVVYENKKPGMFLDAMEFWNELSGIVIGDPVAGKFFIARTFDGGATWAEIPEQYKPVADSGEACFAASGTNIRTLDRDEAVFVSGGLQSHIFIRGEKRLLPIAQGTTSSGANSVAVMDNNSRKGGKTIMVVGGDFAQPQKQDSNCVYSDDRGRTWKTPKTPPKGYRSSVEFLSKKHAVSCGISGVDYSMDGGKNWKAISSEGFHVVRIAKRGATTFLAGANGRIAKLVY